MIRVAMNVGVALRYVCRGSTSSLPNGRLVIVEPGEVHRATAEGQHLDADVISIDPSALSRLVRGEPWAIRTGFALREPVRASAALVRAFHGLSAALRDVDIPALLAEQRALGFLAALRRELNAGPLVSDRAQRSDGVRRAREMIHDRYNEQLRLDELAGISGLSRLGFMRSFKRLVGVPPHAYQMRLRLDHARRLIARGTSVSDAAASAGFYDQSHFHRQFLRNWGLTPGAYCRHPWQVFPEKDRMP
jgi:AraC-like DNA-binding protein